MRNSAEALLGLFAGRDRAAAMMGDLTELGVSRGGLWFAAAYTRTLVACGWRAPAAFLVAMASVAIMVRVYPVWVQYALRHLSAGLPVDLFFGRLAVAAGPFLQAIAQCLWFTLPYAWVRFGRSERLTRCALLLLMSTLPVFSMRVWLTDASCILTLLVLLCAVFSSSWRRPMAVLVATSVTLIAAVFASLTLLAFLGHRAMRNFTPTSGMRWMSTSFAFGLAAIVCSVLHRRLMEHAGTPDIDDTPGAAHA